MMRSDVVVSLLLGLLLLRLAHRSDGMIDDASTSKHSNMFQYSRVEKADVDKGTKWAVLVAGSRGYDNYRHQADVCHAYQILKKGGLKDENIIVFMYDDIAYNQDNPRKGIIINKPGGPDVYAGVPKDYTKSHTTAANLYAVLLGNKNALSGGSGKVLNTGPNDHIFIYYADHGSPGILGMPVGDYVYAKDLMRVLKKKHDAGNYKSMVIYVEACEAGSMFEGVLPNNINIYTTTASNTKESSWGTYCSDDASSIYYGTCLGDLYSVSWMEDCDAQDLSKETLKQQYNVVKKRTNNSHVMEYGYMGLNKEFLSTFMGVNPYNKHNDEVVKSTSTLPTTTSKVVGQRDVDLVYLQKVYQKAPLGSSEKVEAKKRLEDEVTKRKQEDTRMKSIAKLVMGKDIKKINMVMKTVRPDGQPLVDDWDCFKLLVKSYEQHCGRLSKYGRKYSRVIANMCNAGVKNDQMARASIQACSTSTTT